MKKKILLRQCRICALSYMDFKNKLLCCSMTLYPTPPDGDCEDFQDLLNQERSPNFDENNPYKGL